jgi:hypothetical protein
MARNVVIGCLCLAACSVRSASEWTPAVQNQKVDAKNDTALLHNGMADFERLARWKAEGPDSWHAGIHQFLCLYV